MKAGLLLASLVMFTGLANAKNTSKRFLVTFKSQQGFVAMQKYLNQESSSGLKLQKSLLHTNSVILKGDDSAAVQGALSQLASHPEVYVVEAEKFTPSPKPVHGFKLARVVHLEKANISLDRSANLETNQIERWQPGEKTPWGIQSVKAGEAWVDSQAGNNARVLVLDTGVDHGHQDIKDNFEKGMNFTENDNGDVDANDFADSNGHGTHTSGTIAGAYNPQTGFTGVAPKAKLLMGRVCGADGCSNISVVEGINWGVSEKVDIINMSLGGAATTSAERAAVSSAERAGVVIVAASGNGGTGVVSFPAAISTIVAVGAIESNLVKASFSQWGPELDVVAPGGAVFSTIPRGTGRDSSVNLTINGVTKSVKSTAFSGTKLTQITINNTMVYAGLGKSEDFKNINVKGKFALISRGEIKFTEKIQNAITAKAIGVIIFNNVAGLIQGLATEEDAPEIDFPVVMIEQPEGDALVTALTQGQAATAEVRTMASDYASLDGTSMATPHVAGVVALMKSANKKLSPLQVRTILATTAMPLGPNTKNEYGRGLVQADRAVQAALAIR